MNSLRICHLGKYYPPTPGGIETHTRTLARAQAELGAEVRVICVRHGRGPTAVEQDGPVEVTRLGRLASAAKIDVCPGLPGALRRAAAESDVLHMQVPNPTMILGLLAAGVRTPLVVTYQSDLVRQRVRGLLFRPLERLAYRRVRAVLASSPTYADGSPFLRSYTDRLSVLPHGIDLAPYRDPSLEHRAEAARIRASYPTPIWLTCGRMVYYKGLPTALRALTELPGTLLLIGGGRDRLALEQEARRLGVADRAVFLGNLPHYLDLVPYYLAADAFWFPSNARSESFGLVQVEAMAAGCPLINCAIPHSGVPWVCRHEQEGLTVPVDDPSAFAAAARRLLDEPNLRERLTATARERADREFDHRVMARRSLEVYRRVLGVAASSQISTIGQPPEVEGVTPTSLPLTFSPAES
jgi:rhamnosyl/mannosyltransferase